MKIPLIGCGSLSLLVGGFFSCVGVGMVVSPSNGADRLDGVFAGGLFGLFPVVVGLIMLLVGLVLHVQDRRRARSLSWLRTRDRFSVEEFAQAHGLVPADAENKLHGLLQGPGAPPLVYHRARREYLRRSALPAGGRTVDRCGSCGAGMALLLMPGETGACPHCGTPC